VPVEPFELLKIVIGISIITIPGYLWSFLFFKNLKPLERLVFGFLLILGVICCGTFTIDVLFSQPVTGTKVFLLLAVYSIPSVVLYILSIYRSGLPKPNLEFFKKPKFILLLLIIAFSVFMIFLPHWSDNYYLPFHVDEWIHWDYSRAMMKTGSSAFTNPYTGSGTVRSLELGFHFITASIKWITGATFNSIVVFMPSIIAVFTSLAAFNIGERSERKFGLEAALLVSFIPTTCRMMGPSFYVAVTMGLLFVVFIIWLGQLRKTLAALLIPFFIWCVFLVHPPSALAGIIIAFLYAILLILEKEYKLSVLTLGLSLIPIVLVFLLATRWDYSLQQVIDAFFGGQTFFSEYDLPQIWPSFEHLGIVTWILCIIGAYYAFNRGKVIQRTITLSAIAFIALIGLYDKLGYGLPIMYERSFMYLFLMVALIAGFGMSELRRLLIENREKIIPKKYKLVSKNIGFIVPTIVCILLVTTAVPAHLDIPYYQMIDEQDYETFTWIRDNIDNYRDKNHPYDRAAVDPFKASPFSTVTGLYIVSSSMHPIYGYSLHSEMENFLSNKCVDTSFMETHKISAVYGSCSNDDLIMIYPSVYLYPGLYEK